MAKYPEPQVGLVISYACLWSEEAEKGRVEGRKDRPCAIILAIDEPADAAHQRKHVAVVPITHSRPHNPNVAVEIPAGVKKHLGLDSDPSWVILDELNEFVWPGFDLRPIKGDDSRIDYGLLPPKLFDRLIEKFVELREQGNVAQTSRDDASEERPSSVGRMFSSG
jgi:hypothetical protein